MSEAIDLTGFTGGKTCPICGKDFIVLYPQYWTYKRGGEHHQRYLCSYSCLRVFDGKKEKKGDKKQVVNFGEKNRKAIEIAIAGGDPVEFLREQGGSTNPAGLWAHIRNELKDREPETFAKLPTCKRDRRATNRFKPQKAEVPEAPAAQFPGVETPEDTFKAGMDLAKIKPAPMKYDGMTVRALEGEFGSYHFDTVNGVEYIDYENKDGDELSMTVDNWRGFLAELSHAAAILGVQL